MIIVNLFGGLGNQMFQYAIGRHLSIKNNQPLKLNFIDINAFSKREYGLWCFKLNQVVKKTTLNNIIFFNLISKIKDKVNSSLVNENNFAFNKTVIDIRKKNIKLNGYWQTEKYFITIREILLEDFRFIMEPLGANKNMLERIIVTNSISVHIRRGDYVEDKQTNEFHGTCSLSYYHNAIEYIAKKIKNPKLYFFSDDINWVKNNIKTKYESMFIDWNIDKNSFEDMRLMSNCKYNIIANSSFSWWGAWLNKNPNKIVIAPQKWFNTSKINTKDIIPNSWVKI